MVRVTLHGRRLEMANACQRAGNQHRREGCREDEAWRIAADHVDDAAIRSYIAAHAADRFGERALEHREALRGAITVRNPSPPGTVKARKEVEAGKGGTVRGK